MSAKRKRPGSRPRDPLAAETTIDVVVESRQADTTLASVVREALGGLAWSKARGLCSTGRVTVDGMRTTDPAVRVAEGVRVRIAPTAPRMRGGTLAPEAIVYLDADVVVVEKPAGMMSVPFSAGDRDHLLAQTQAALRRVGAASGRASSSRSSSGQGSQRAAAPLGVVQRLDKDTTGLLVFARSLAAKRHLAGQLRQRTVHRRYLAIVNGVPSSPSQTFESWLVPNRGDGLRGSFGVFRRPRGARPQSAQLAITHMHLREALADAALVECQLETGRQHQIRIHLSEAGHPLVGERVYIRDFEGPRLPGPRPLLHAAELGFEHPRTGQPMRFESPMPNDFEQMLTRLRTPSAEPR
jgi:23S rRNA pseudouridine1911/1915/1917 synthase